MSDINPKAPSEVTAGPKLHIKARTPTYPFTEDQVQRYPVPDEKVDWSVEWPDYNPTKFTSDLVQKRRWADLEINDRKFKPNWNHLDGTVDRVSQIGVYEIVDSCPRNPAGRTGLTGRGILGRWGPNHSAEPIITRWKRDLSNTLVADNLTNMPILQFIGIWKEDATEWSLPEGTIDLGEKIPKILQEEFCEEALYSIRNVPYREKARARNLLPDFFKNGLELYKGYKDDERNTDNAWLETIIINYHDGIGDCVAKFPLHNGEGNRVCWVDINISAPLDPALAELLQDVAKCRKAHW